MNKIPPSFWLATGIRYVMLLAIPLLLIRVLCGPGTPLAPYAGMAALGAFVLVTLFSGLTTARRYTQRRTAQDAPVTQQQTVSLGRR